MVRGPTRGRTGSPTGGGDVVEWPVPFSGIEYFVELDSEEQLAAFVTWALTGCGGEKRDDGTGAYHQHNFAIDTGQRRVFGSPLLMECLQRWKTISIVT